MTTAARPALRRQQFAAPREKTDRTGGKQSAPRHCPEADTVLPERDDGSIPLLRRFQTVQILPQRCGFIGSVYVLWRCSDAALLAYILGHGVLVDHEIHGICNDEILGHIPDTLVVAGLSP